jgi:phosphohistidine swiveling domain-containing protein
LFVMGEPFEAPGPGQWSLDRSHFTGGVTPISQSLHVSTMGRGMERVFAEIGAPIRRIDSGFVNGFNYTRVRPLVGGDRAATKLPPVPVLKVMTRLHPEFRRRAKAARSTLDDKPFLAVAERWEREFKPGLVAANRDFQSVDLKVLDDDQLQTHILGLLDHCRSGLELHFWLHGHDLAPIARLVHESVQWGLDGGEVAAALVGASPSTARPAELLVRLRAIVDASGAEVTSLDDVRACSPEAAELLDEYLAERGSVLATGYDITSFTLGEMPGAILTSIRVAVTPAPADADAAAASLRERVPAAERSRFDEYLSDARAVMDMRDDNGPITAEWPLGLLRLALLEAGTRLVDRGDLVEAEHVLDLTEDEARQLFAGPSPGADVVAARVARRRELAELDPPLTLGVIEAQPPLDVLPDPLPEIVGMVQAAMRHMGMDGDVGADPFVGVGVGTQAYTGRARTASSAEEAFEKLEPGDVLVVRATSPAFNVVLSIAGAVVTANGGALSHAAVLARELGIPAVVGAPGALEIPDGAMVEVDPVAGAVGIV